MKTTSLFVEIFVIGTGAAIWILLLVLTVFDYTWLDATLLGSWDTLVPIAALVYVLGIVIDRTADTVLRKPDRRIREQAFTGAAKDYHYVRTYVFYRSETFKDIFDYARSKLRICRAWVFNFTLIGLMIPIFVWTRLPHFALLQRLELSASGVVVCFVLAYGSWYTWRHLTRNYYLRLLHAYEVINKVIKEDKAASTELRDVG